MGRMSVWRFGGVGHCLQNYPACGRHSSDYSKQMSADSLFNPCVLYGPQTPLKMFLKNPPPPKKKKKNLHEKAVQTNILWLTLNKIRDVSILQSEVKNKGTPHFTFMRRAQNVVTHALKQQRLSQIIPTVCSSF